MILCIFLSNTARIMSLLFSICRRELDNSEAERAQHLSQICDLQEHIQGKDSQILALQEQVDFLKFPILLHFSQLSESHILLAVET